MATWSDFFAQFSGSYLSVAQQLRDDTAITEVDYFHELRSLGESGLITKLSALTSVSPGFLDEWASFLNTEKGDVAVGSQSAEPAYSDGKWSEFKIEFDTEYSATLDGLRNDIKHSYFPAWTNYVAEFGSDYQSLAGALETDPELSFGDINTFLETSQSNLASAFKGLQSSGNFIDELAQLLDAKKEELDSGSGWSAYESNFDSEYQTMIANLQNDLTGMSWAAFFAKTVSDHRTDLATSGDTVFDEYAQILINVRDADWERLKALTQIQLRDKLALLDSSSEFYAEYAKVVYAEMDNVVNLFDKLLDEFEDEEKHVVADFIEYLETSAGGSGLSDFETLVDKNENEVSNYLQAFLQTGGASDYADYYCNEIKTEINSVWGTACEPERNKEDIFLNTVATGMQKGVSFFTDYLIENDAGVDTIEDIGSLSLAAITTHLAALPCSDDYIHAQADEIRKHAEVIIPKYTYSFTLHGKLEDDQVTPEILPGIPIEVIDSSTDEVIGSDITAEDGRFFVNYTVLHEKVNLPASTDVDIKVYDFEENVVHTESDVTITVGSTAATVVSITVPTVSDPDSGTIADIFSNHPTATFPATLSADLTTQEISTLYHVRNVGGLDNHEFDVSVDTEASDVITAITLIDQHAVLDSVNPDDIVVNQQLIDDGYISLGKISKTNLATFQTDTAAYFDAVEAEKVKKLAIMLNNMNRNLTTSVIVDNQYTPTSNFSFTFDNEDWEDISRKVNAKYTSKCNFPESHSAVSPLAYLYDLIGYVSEYVKDGSSAIDINYLEEKLNQRFSELGITSAKAEEEVCQTRIVVEILRDYFAENGGISIPAGLEDEYLKRSYLRLLDQLNISYTRLAKVRNADNIKKDDFYTKTNLEDQSANHQLIADLYHDVSASSLTLTEEILEVLFGLVDTSRNPLSTCVKISSTDAGSALLEWNFEGVVAAYNTDSEGNVYVSLEESATDEYTVTVYKASGETEDDKVAETVVTSSTTDGIAYLLELNNSGISGYVKFNYTTDISDVQFSIVPTVLMSRLRKLRAGWKEIDAGRVLIDPDIVAPEDFRNPYETGSTADTVAKLWNTRKGFLDGKYADSLLDSPSASFASSLPDTGHSTSINSIVITEDGKVYTSYGTDIRVDGNTLFDTKTTNGQLRRDSDDNLYLAEGTGAKIFRYERNVGGATPSSTMSFTYDPGAAGYTFKDLAVLDNGDIIAGGAYSSKDALVKFTSVKEAFYKGNRILWDAVGNAYVLNSNTPSVIKYNKLGEPITGFGYRIDNAEHVFEFEDDLTNDGSESTLAELNGSANYVSDGKNDKGLALNGVDNYLTLDTLVESSNANNYSFALWFKPLNAENTNRKQVLLTVADDDGNQGFSVYLHGSELFLNRWEWNVDEYVLAPESVKVKGVSTGEWTHVTVVMETVSGGAEKDNGLTLYVNGAKAGSLSYKSIAANANVLVGGTDGTIEVHSHFQDEDSEVYELLGADHRMAATVDAVTVFNRSISFSDVAALYDDTLLGAMTNPVDIAIDNLGQVHVLDNDAAQVLIFANDGAYIRSIILTATAGTDDYTSVSISSQNHVYVAHNSSSDNGQIQRFDDAGDSLTAVTDTFTTDINGICVTAEDQLYVVITGSNTIKQYLSDGTTVGTVTLPAGLSTSTFSSPESICQGLDGKLYIADSGNKRILELNADHSKALEWSYGSSEDNFMFESLGTASTFSYVSVDKFNNICFSHGDIGAGTADLFTTAMPKVISDGGGDGSLKSIAVNSFGEIFMSKTNTIERYDPVSKGVVEICSNGSGEGQVQGPGTLAVDALNRLYIADTTNNRVQVVDREGNFVRDFSEFETGSVDFAGVNALALNDNLKLVCNGVSSSSFTLLKLDTNYGIASVISESEYFDTTLKNLYQLEQDEAKGISIDNSLETYRLSKPAYRFLMDMVREVQLPSDEVWESFKQIAVQAAKNAVLTAWKTAETDAGIYAGPEFFNVDQNFDYAEPRELTTWRATYTGLRNWKKLLQSRGEQEKTTRSAHFNEIRKVEEETMGLLRNALIEASDATGTLLSDKAEWMTERLMVECENNCCTPTTRLAVAIETIQSLVWRIRTGQLGNTFMNLTLDHDDFENSWKWRNNYAAWKSAQFVNLFPENLLMPEIKPNQTAKYAEIVKQLNNDPYITPEDACRLANGYEGYLNTISNFDDVIGCYGVVYKNAQAPCKAQVPIHTGESINDNGEINAELEPQNVIYLFGLHKASGKIFYALYDFESEVGKSSDAFIPNLVSDWREVPGVKNADSIAGAVSYPLQPRSSLGWSRNGNANQVNVYFTKIKESGMDAQFSQLNLKSQVWLGPKSIHLPDGLGNDHFHLFIAGGAANTKMLITPKQETSRIYRNYVSDNNDGLKYSEWIVDESPMRHYTSSTKYYYLGVTKSGEGSDWLKFKDRKERDKAKQHYTSQSWGVFEDEGVEVAYIADERIDVKIHKMTMSVIVYSWRGDYYLNWDNRFQLPNKKLTLSDKSSLFKLNSSRIENPFVESAFRWQDSPNKFVVVFANEKGHKAYTIVEKQSTRQLPIELKSGLLYSSRKIGSAIYSPESHDGSLWGSLNTRVIQFGDGAFQLGNHTMLSSGKLFFPRTVRNVTPYKNHTVRSGTGSAGVSFEFNRPSQFGLSIKPFGDSGNRAFSLLQVHNGLKTHWNKRCSKSYFYEAYYYLPMLIASRLQQNGYYQEALDWYRLVYDYSLDPSESKIFPHLVDEESATNYHENQGQFLNDPENPHNIAMTRKNAFTRYTVAAIARCFMEYADQEFTKDNSESIAKAGVLYETAIDLLGEVGFNEGFTACQQTIKTKIAEIESHVDFSLNDEWWPIWEDLKKQLQKVESLVILSDLLDKTDDAGETDEDIKEIMLTVAYNDEEKLEKARIKIQSVLGRQTVLLDYDTTNLTEDLVVNISFKQIWGFKFPTKIEAILDLEGTLGVNYNFGIPRNPVKDYLMMYAEVNLFKMRNCMNIAGMSRKVANYSTSTDTITGLSYIGVGGQIVQSGTANNAPSTQYHYKVILQRAKELTSIAQQMEYSLLSSLEKLDAETYSIQRAEQDLKLTEEQIRLQDLRLDQADMGVKQADLQKERTQLSIDRMNYWISSGPNEFELNLMTNYMALMWAMNAVTAAQTTATTLGYAAQAANLVAQASKVLDAAQSGGAATVANTTGAASYVAAAVAAGISGVAQIGANTINYHIQLNSFKAAHQRRVDEWTYQRDLASKDREIANVQIQIAKSQTRVVGQEKRMSELQAQFAQATADFLYNKFTNAELYRWMSQVLEGVYAYFLRQATNMATLAARQLAFERQENVPVVIQQDYWKIAQNGNVQAGVENNADRKGLTGSARLLRDIYKLDQYAFDTDTRRLELTKTISLASLLPQEFQEFKETGVLSFRTNMEYFDRDFPGHYLRLIKQIKIQVVALVPPIDGIKAQLTSSGISEVVVGSAGTPFTNTQVVRSPETITLTGSNAPNGLFELTSVYHNEKLLPFEGSGIDTNWELRMPKAANYFDYRSIADVIFTIDYTAKEDLLYKQQVIHRLDNTVSLNRAFSFRNHLSDQWFDLLHPDETATPMKVSFDLSDNDFPANVADLEIENVLLYFSLKESTDKVQLNVNLRKDRSGGKASTNDENLISFNSSSGSSWSGLKGEVPTGTWVLEFPDEMITIVDENGDDLEVNNLDYAKKLFCNESIEDLLFVITYEGTTPSWTDDNE